jgi:hypothetical protein
MLKPSDKYNYMVSLMDIEHAPIANSELLLSHFEAAVSAQ